jgi:succinoglycan biosynthesis transport protein ExoP
MNNPAKEKTLFDVTDILAIILKRIWLIILPVVLITAVTVVGSYLITPEYESSVIVSMGPTVQLSTELQRLLGNAGQSYDGRQTRQLELRSLQNEITSSPYISQLIQNLKLDQDAGLESAAEKVQTEQSNLTLNQIKFDILLTSLRDKIAIDFAGRNQIRITAQSADQFLARDMAQQLAEIFIAEKMKQELGSIRLSQDFSYEQLSKYEKDLREKIDEKTRLEKEFMNVQLGVQVGSDENRNEINAEIENVRIEIEDRKTEERALLRNLTHIPQADLKLKESVNLAKLQKEIKKHLELVGGQMLKYSWSDGEILNFKVRLFSLIGDLEDEVDLLVGRQFGSQNTETQVSLRGLFGARYILDVLYSQINALQLAQNDLDEKVSLIPEYQAHMDQLNREINAARELRDTFKNLQEGSQISQALLRESRYKVVEPAKVPLAPFKPQRKKIVLMGFLLGIAIGGSVLLLAEVLDKSFRKIEDIEEALGIPVVGVIPQIDLLKKLKIKS